MKFSTLRIIFLLGALSVAQSCAKKTEPKIIRFAYTAGPSELLHKAAEQFARQVAEESNGALEVRLYPGGQLGNERELVEGLKLRGIDIIVTGLAVVGWYAPEYGMFEAPFLWRDYEHLENVWNGEIGAELRAVMLQRTSTHLMQPWYRGPRYLTTTSRKVLNPADLAGLKLRVPELTMYIESWKTFGANVSPVPFTDMFMALKLGVVDGQENPLATIYACHLHEVQKYVMETRHLISFYIPAVGPSIERRLRADEKAIFYRALADATRWHNLEVERAESDYRDKLEAAGVTFVPLDTTPFRKLATERLPEIFKESWKPDVFERIAENQDTK
jgi:TRAP-type transport system periplasmic protein